MTTKQIWSLAVAAVLGMPAANAANAEHARVTLDMKAPEAKVERVAPPYDNMFTIKERIKPGSIEAASWYFVRVPMKVEGKGKATEPITFVNDLKVHFYLVFIGENNDDLTMAETEITYTEIPVKPGQGDKPSEGTLTGAVFISPANAAKICGTKSKVDLTGHHLGAVAIEATFGGSNCLNPKEDPSIIIDNKLKGKLTSGWWKKKSAPNKKGVVICSIAETPFAPYYAALSGAPTVPMYGSAGSAASAASSSSSSASDTSSTDAGSDSGYAKDTALSDTGADDDAADTGTDKKKDKKKKKKAE